MEETRTATGHGGSGNGASSLRCTQFLPSNCTSPESEQYDVTKHGRTDPAINPFRFFPLGKNGELSCQVYRETRISVKTVLRECDKGPGPAGRSV